MKLKEFGPPRERASLAPPVPLDPPLINHLKTEIVVNIVSNVQSKFDSLKMLLHFFNLDTSQATFNKHNVIENNSLLIYRSKLKSPLNYPPISYLSSPFSGGSRIFLRGVRQLPKVLLFCKFFAENCMKMKEFGFPGGVPAPPLDPPIPFHNYQ